MFDCLRELVSGESGSAQSTVESVITVTERPNHVYDLLGVR
jgi:hypothetical protein